MHRQHPQVPSGGIVLPNGQPAVTARLMRCERGHEWQEPNQQVPVQIRPDGTRCCPLCFDELLGRECGSAGLLTPDVAQQEARKLCPACGLAAIEEGTGPNAGLAKCATCDWNGVAIRCLIERTSAEAPSE